MAKSRTRKKSAKKQLPPLPADAKEQLNLVTDYLRDWTKREIGRIQKTENAPLCIPTDRGYRIGSFQLERGANNRSHTVYNAHHELVHTFEDRVSAILYVVYTIKQKYSVADNILSLDKEINKNTIDILSMRRCIARARQQSDFDIVDIRTARVEIAEAQLIQARDNLLKIHRHAKYNKVWDN